MLIYADIIINDIDVYNHMSTGSADAQSTAEAEFETIAKSLGENRRELLTAFLETDKSTLTTADLRGHTTVPRGSIIHHLERLRDWGLIEEQEEREFDSRSGRQARVWAITERGESFCAEEIDAPASAFVSPEEVAALKERVADLEKETQRIDDLEEQLEAMKRILRRITEEIGLLSEEEQARIFGDG